MLNSLVNAPRRHALVNSAHSTASSNHADSIQPSSATASLAGSSTLHSVAASTSTSTASLSATEHLRDTFNKRIRSLVYLKHSLQGHTTWFSTIQLHPDDLHAFFDNQRMHKRSLRYSILGLSLSAILDIPNPSDTARAIISLFNELDAYTDDNIVALTSATGADSFGTQRPKVRSFFKTGKQTLKRSTAAQAISEFGTIESGSGPASTLAASNEPNSYLMAPNIPFQLDFFQTFLTLCDMLTEVYYKLASFLPRDVGSAEAAVQQNPANLARASSPPTSISAHVSQDRDRTPSISHSFSSAAAAAVTDASADTTADKPGLVISAITQELLIKADAKIKKVVNVQLKEIDEFARQMIKDELASLDPLIQDLGLDTPVSRGSTVNSAAFPSTSTDSTHSSNPTTTTGLATTSTSALPFTFSNQPPSTTTPSKLSTRTASQFRRTSNAKSDAHHGHHHLNLGGTTATAPSINSADIALTTSRSGRLKRIVSPHPDVPSPNRLP